MKWDMAFTGMPGGVVVGNGARASWSVLGKILDRLFGRAAAKATGTFVRETVQALPAGKSAGVHLVESAAELKSLFGRLTAGGKVVKGSTYPGTLMSLPDATTVGLRASSKSVGPAIDINLGAHELLKVHVK
jgi:hypothetical protein